MRGLLTWVLVVGLVAVAVLPSGGGASQGTDFRQAVSSPLGVVASVSELASQAGVRILHDGGNAMDAAVATVFAVGVTRPEMCGIGGGGFLIYRGASGDVAALDFRERAPAAFTPDTFQPAEPPEVGHLVIGVPGVVDGMARALDAYGTISLADAIAPAETLARVGFAVTPEFSAWNSAFAPLNRLFNATAEIYLIKSLAPYPPGERLVQRDYADSLKLIQEQGPNAFYRGRIAELIVHDMQQASGVLGTNNDQGLMTAKDLADYAAVWRDPVVGAYRDTEIVGAPPPAAGGIFVLEALNILEGFDLNGFGHSSANTLHVLAEVMEIAHVDRLKYVSDPDFRFDYDKDGDLEGVPTAQLTSQEYADARRTEINLSHANAYGPGKIGEPGHTTHVSVIDRWNNAVSVTCTLEGPYGSHVVAPGTGFLLNGQLSDFTAKGTANQPDSGKRPRTSMSPTIVVRSGVPILAVGAGGGSRIPEGILNSIVNVVDFGMDIAHALDAERLGKQSGPTTEPATNMTVAPIELENRRVPAEVQAELSRRHFLIESQAEYLPLLLQVEATGVDSGTLRRTAASDVRGEWGATAVNEAPLAAGTSDRTEVDRVRPVHFTDLSTDPDGRVVKWLWDFGDGKTSTDQHPSHLYKQLGTFEVFLTVEDDCPAWQCGDHGDRDTAHVATITVKNIPPRAGFGGHEADQNRVDRTHFTDQSTDPDGSITARAWSFGDGGTSNAANPTHQYTRLGTFPATVTVTDNDGATSSTGGQVTVVNLPPTASFTGPEADQNRVDPTHFTDQSSDRDGTLSWAWTFGDGVTSTIASPSHQYTTLGTFPVTLTVTDNDGATATASSAVTIINLPPVLRFEVKPTYPKAYALTHFLDHSLDRDGSVQAWHWDLGDGATSAKDKTTHRYLGGGNRTLRLALMDNEGAVSSAAALIYVCVPHPEAQGFLHPDHIHFETHSCVDVGQEDLGELAATQLPDPDDPRAWFGIDGLPPLLGLAVAWRRRRPQT